VGQRRNWRQTLYRAGGTRPVRHTRPGSRRRRLGSAFRRPNAAAASRFGLRGQKVRFEIAVSVLVRRPGRIEAICGAAPRHRRGPATGRSSSSRSMAAPPIRIRQTGEGRGRSPARHTGGATGLRPSTRATTAWIVHRRTAARLMMMTPALPFLPARARERAKKNTLNHVSCDIGALGGGDRSRGAAGRDLLESRSTATQGSSGRKPRQRPSSNGVRFSSRRGGAGGTIRTCVPSRFPGRTFVIITAALRSPGRRVWKAHCATGFVPDRHASSGRCSYYRRPRAPGWGGGFIAQHGVDRLAGGVPSRWS